MGFLDRLFGSSSPSSTPAPDVAFGRYADAYKSPAQLGEWERCMQLFDQGERLTAYKAFLHYLQDPQLQNVSWKEENGGIDFELRQGSRRVIGRADADKVKAESKIAKAADLNVGFLRRLLEFNYTLKYSRFALDPDNFLSIRFDTSAIDGSPLKLYHALRELATHADKQDDLLLDEFRSLSPAESPDSLPMPEAEKQLKYDFIVREIQAAFALLDAGKPDSNQFPGGYAYLLLALAFRLDYLVRPEGFMMDTLERIHGIYFAQDGRNPQLKLLALRKEFQKLLDRSKEDFFKEMYRTRSTFGVSQPVHHDRVKAVIEGELPNMEWHLKEGHAALALSIPEYIAGFVLFHYAPPKPDRELLHLFFEITEPEFFRALGFKSELLGPDGLPRKNALAAAFKNIADRNRLQFPAFRPDANRLNYSTLPLFAKSYLEMIKDLDLTRAE